MPGDRKLIFDAVKQLGVVFTKDAAGAAKVKLLDKAIDAFEAPLIAKLTPTPVLSAPVQGQFALSQKSLDKLYLVHPKLKACVLRAIQISIVDFRVNQGLRSLEEQRKAVASGNSRTMKSKHLQQKDGYVWAVDLVALVNGQVSWEMKYYAAIAFAMDQAATELGIADNIRWGCAWDRVLSDYGGDANSYMAEVKAYAARHPGSDLLDGPHFEWVP